MFIPYDKELDFNYLSLENNVKVISSSSGTKGCSASNVLSNDRKSIWLTESGVPQNVVIDTGGMFKKPKSCFKYFGVYCWHAYSTNPKVIEIQFSNNNKNYTSLGTYDISLKPGTQIFEIKKWKLLETDNLRYFKVVILETYGGSRTYLNQVYLFDRLVGEPQEQKTLRKRGQSEGAFRARAEEVSDLFSQSKNDSEDSESEPGRETYRYPTEIEDDSNYKDLIDEHEISIRESPRKKNVSEGKNKLNKTFTYQNGDDNKYSVLEIQLKDMEEYLKSMSADIKLQDYDKYGSIRHSKSLSFLNNHRETSDLFNNNYKGTNPFLHKGFYNPKQNELNTQQIQTDKINNLSKYLNTEEIGNENFTLNKIQKIEEKLNKFDSEISDIKYSLDKLIQSVNRLINKEEKESNYKESNCKESNYQESESVEKERNIINYILNECSRMISDRLSKEVTNNTKKIITKHKDDFEDNLERKIENKFESMATNIESQIYNNLLKPSISTIEKTMQSNFDEIKERIRTLNTLDTSALNNSNVNESISDKYKSISRGRNVDDRLQEMNALGGRLYEKLLEKEKKLNELKNETTHYLKKKLNARNNLLTSSMQSNSTYN